MKTYEDCYTVADTLIAAKEALIKEYHTPMDERKSAVVVVPFFCLTVTYDVSGLPQEIVDSTVRFIDNFLETESHHYGTFYNYLCGTDAIFSALTHANYSGESTRDEKINEYLFEEKLKWIDTMIAEAKEKGI